MKATEGCERCGYVGPLKKRQGYYNFVCTHCFNYLKFIKQSRGSLTDEKDSDGVQK